MSLQSLVTEPQRRTDSTEWDGAKVITLISLPRSALCGTTAQRSRTRVRFNSTVLTLSSLVTRRFAADPESVLPPNHRGENFGEVILSSVLWNVNGIKTNMFNLNSYFTHFICLNIWLLSLIINSSNNEALGRRPTRPALSQPLSLLFETSYKYI